MCSPTRFKKHTSTGLQTTPSQWCSIGPRMEICVNSGVPFGMVPRFHQIFIAKGSYGNGESQNVLSYSVEKAYLPVRAYKLHHFMRFSIVPRKEICGSSGLPIAMVPRYHQCNVHVKPKLWVWRCQKCIPLVGAKTVLICTGLQTTPFHAGQCKDENRNLRKFGSPIGMVPCLHQSNVYISRKLRVWRAQKCAPLLGA